MKEASDAAVGEARPAGSLHSRKSFLQRSAASAVLMAGGGSLLAACGGGDNNTSSGGSPSGPVTLTLLNWHTNIPDTGFGAGYIAQGKAYEQAHRNTTVKFVAKPFAGYVPFITSAAKTKTLASNVALVPGLNQSAVFPALETLTRAQVAPIFNDLSGWLDVQTSVESDGQYAGLPFTGQGIVWYYNKALFRRAGLDPEQAPQTWDDFATACDKLKGAGITPIAISGKDSYTPFWAFASWTTQFYPTAADVQAFATGQIPFTDSGIAAAANALAETSKRGWWNADYKGKAAADAQDDFVKGKIAMFPGIITAGFSWDAFDKLMGRGTYGVFLPPLLDGAKVSAPNAFFYPSILLGVAKDAKDPDAALEYNKFLVSREGQTLMLAKGGAFPNRLDVDIEGITRSPGAATIANLVRNGNPVDCVTTWLKSAAYAKSIPLLTPAAASGDINGYLKEIDSLQAKA